MQHSQCYQEYAAIYDAIGQGRWSAQLAAWALGWLAERAAAPARVLDLACGTGEAALVFGAAGCAVVGIDQSAVMLAIARGKARDAGYDLAFEAGDMRRLNQRRAKGTSAVALKARSFDLATCLYDSMNYLLGDGDLGRVCAGVAAMLRPGGHFIFDLNTVAEYESWDERDTVTYDGRGCLVYNKLNYDPDTQLASGRIVWFVRETERWWRGEETHTERAWRDAEVATALAGAGLVLIGRLDAAGAPATAAATRIVYVAQRPADSEKSAL